MFDFNEMDLYKNILDSGLKISSDENLMELKKEEENYIFSSTEFDFFSGETFEKEIIQQDWEKFKKEITKFILEEGMND